MIKFSTIKDLSCENNLIYIFGKLADGHYVNDYNTESWFKYGKSHCENGPARLYANGSKEFFQNGKWYRENDLPVAEYADGKKVWIFNKKNYYNYNEYILAKTMA